MKVVGFCGPIGAGKTTAASYLTGRGYNRVSFAQPVRDIVYDLYGLDKLRMRDRDYECSPREELGGATVKRALQLFGTEAGRTLWGDTWVNALRRTLEENGQYVIDDLRFPNEIEMIQSLGGLIVYIERGKSKKPSIWERLFGWMRPSLGTDGRDKRHASESYHEILRERADIILSNEGSIRELELKVEAALSRGGHLNGVYPNPPVVGC